MIKENKVNVLITGSRGFIGKNLVKHLENFSLHKVFTFNRGDDLNELASHINLSDVIFHFAGANRESSDQNFQKDNIDLSKFISKTLESSRSRKIIIFTSSIQAELDNDYGKSKLRAEQHFKDITNQNIEIKILRLTNIFGKWSEPNYNSAIATFCSNINNNIPIQVEDPSRIMKLIYIDDLIFYFLEVINNFDNKLPHFRVNPYEITLQELVDKLYKFKQKNYVTSTGVGIDRALYATFLSYKNPSDFKYNLQTNEDNRGKFIEILKTKESGQFSYFTANPGITRGGHYHHTKNEKFLVVQGKAKFVFKNLIDDKIHAIEVSDENPEIVETIPGWGHDITNIGNKELIVFLWANEVFQKNYPDTYKVELKNEES